MSSPRSPSQTLLLGPPPVDFSPRLVPIPPSPALSSASPTTPPQSPGSQAEQAKAASTLTGIQVEVVAKVDKIHSQANTHPYSKLQQLQQARIVLNVTKEDLGTIGRKSTVKIGATIRDEIPEFSHSRTAASKKVALLEAAAQVFEDVVTFLRHSPPRAFLEVATVPVPKRDGPTIKQIKELEEDKVHVSVLRDIATRATVHHNSFFRSSCVCTKGKVGILSIDLEQYEMNSKIPLEAGISFLPLPLPELELGSRATAITAAGTRATTSRHLVVTDHVELLNGKFVANQKHNFDFGTSELVHEVDLQLVVRALLVDICDRYDKIYLVGHTIHSDLKWLRDMDVTFDKDKFVLCDIGRAYRGMKWTRTQTQTRNDDDGNEGARSRRYEYTGLVGMEKMLGNLGVEFRHLHNGGNDANYNVQALLRMVEKVKEKGETLERFGLGRWPLFDRICFAGVVGLPLALALIWNHAFC